MHVALPREALVAVHDVGDQLVHELGRAVGDGEEARPDLAVVEGFASLLEQSEEVVDRGEGELHDLIVNPAATDARAATGPGVLVGALLPSAPPRSHGREVTKPGLRQYAERSARRLRVLTDEALRSALRLSVGTCRHPSRGGQSTCGVRARWGASCRTASVWTAAAGEGRFCAACGLARGRRPGDAAAAQLRRCCPARRRRRRRSARRPFPAGRSLSSSSSPACVTLFAASCCRS